MRLEEEYSKGGTGCEWFLERKVIDLIGSPRKYTDNDGKFSK